MAGTSTRPRNDFSATLSRETLAEALAVLFRDCLHATSEDRILIIYDDAFRPFLQGLVDFLIEKKLHATFAEVPKPYQLALISWSAESGPHREAEVPALLGAALADSSIVLNCLDGELETARLRGAIIDQSRPRECRFAHIPGISEEILRVLTQSPIAEILQTAESVAWGLGEATSAELITYDSQNREYQLRMDLGGWDNEPLMSPGVIFPNSWGNIPPGEVFCCPDPQSVNGQICISGSIPKRPLGIGEEGVLTFSGGLLSAWSPTTSPVSSFLAEENSEAQKQGDPNWNVFAELGIGLNPAVTNLTGNSLFDEKALGTVHVAIGDNKSFGRSVRAHKHVDMVALSPTLRFDAVTIMERGKLVLDDLEGWRKAARVKSLSLRPNSRISLIDAKFERQQGTPMRRLSSAGRVGYVRILNGIDTQLFLRILDEIENQNPPTTYGELRSKMGRDVDDVLAVLQHYRMLDIEN
jgi:Thermophilic metalloprotease (M29)